MKIKRSNQQLINFKWVILTLFLMIPSISIFAQNYRSPLDIPLSMSANFAELRPNHFHGGVDYRVGGVEGAPLKAVEKGYISRIYISPHGYGKAIYINHPDGKTTVYGHLNAFAGAVATYVKEVQYSRERFVLDEYPDSTKFPVSKGQIIGYAGNSGSSFGAHLHFEIRDAIKQAPINPITKGYYKANDKTPPVFKELFVYSVDSINDVLKPKITKSTRTIKDGKVWIVEKNEIIATSNSLFFGIIADDYQENNTSRHGINALNAYLDDQLFFSFKLDQFEFSETRCINSLIDYDQLKSANKTIVRTYIEEGNKLSVYKKNLGNGIITLRDTLTHKVRIEIVDDNGNTSLLNFRIKHKSNLASHHKTVNPANNLTMQWNTLFSYDNKKVKVTLPQASLYSNTFFQLTADSSAKQQFTKWKIVDRGVPLHNKITIGIKPTTINSKIKDKYLLVRHDPKSKTAIGGEFDAQGYLSAEVSELGWYSIDVDTIPPKVSLKSKSTNFKAARQISVNISDNLSGILNYGCYIDNKWMLFDYDAKNRCLNHTFDVTKIKSNQKHSLRVEVTDNRKNKTVFETSIFW